MKPSRHMGAARYRADIHIHPGPVLATANPEPRPTTLAPRENGHLMTPVPPLPARIRRMRTQGWRMPPGAVYVGRPTRWGNPFRVIREGDSQWIEDARRRPWGVPATGDPRETRRLLLAKTVELFAVHVGPMGDYEYDDDTLAELRETLHGRALACWCPLEDEHGRRVACHADVLLELANPDQGRA